MSDHEANTLRAIGWEDCNHPLLVGTMRGAENLCPFCGAEKKGDGSMQGGSVDYVMQPIFAAEARAALKRCEASEKRQ